VFNGESQKVGSTSIVYLPAGTIELTLTVQPDGTLGKAAPTKPPALFLTVTRARRFDQVAVPGGGLSETLSGPAPTSTANTSRSPVVPMFPGVTEELPTSVAPMLALA
jgi:hypothetical protein